jgi:hypothetical protein
VTTTYCVYGACWCTVSQDDPGNADKHAAYLRELNRSKPHEVVARVESKEASSWGKEWVDRAGSKGLAVD